MKKHQTYDFKKLPTSENEEAIDTKISYQELIENINLLKNKWFVAFAIIFGRIFIIWLSTELYYAFFEYYIIKGNSKLSIIINISDEKQNLTYLIRTLANQYLSSCEIIITKNFISNFNESEFSIFERKNVKIRFLQYDKIDTNLKIRIDSASKAIGDYIIFLDPDDYFSENILKDCFIMAIKNKADITQFNHFHDIEKFNKIFRQPKLFDSMYFSRDTIEQKQFHLSGKIIKKDILLESMKDIDNFYLERNNNIYFCDSMIIFKLFKKANSFIKLKMRGIYQYCKKKICIKYLLGKFNYSKEEIKDILIYLKFLIQYTDEKVLEKRMASKFFIDFLVEKPKTKKNYDIDLNLLLDEVVDLYSKCELINEYDNKLISDYRNIQ